MTRSILFLCTGNYYRSRFAEELFNHLAQQHKLNWVSTSRALAIELGIFNHGPMSRHTMAELASRKIPLAEPVRHPMQVSEEDLAAATRVIALKEAEHRPYLAARYPDWPDRVEYWHIHDLDQSTPAQALSEIAEKVTALVESLRRSET
jgi:protein-tyrosine phosphatase